MIIFDRPVYEKIWTGRIDLIISYDPKEGFTVKDISTGQILTHHTDLDCVYLSFSNIDFKSNNDDCIEYLIEKGIKKFRRLPSKFNELIQPTAEAMDKLLDILKKIDSGEYQVVTGIDEDGEYYISCLNNVRYEDLDSYACTSLITIDGQCNWDNINKVKKAGFDVYAGDIDSFGWLVGCIRTSKGIVTYG